MKSSNTKTSTKALRRHHTKRVKNKRKQYWAGHAGTSQRNIGICSQTPCLCSCHLCGNQRKFFGLKHGEQRQKSCHT